jgi:predicted dehydrogenase
MKQSKLRVGVIGVGKMAEISHLPILAKLPQVELVAFCDVDAATLAARADEYGVPHRYSDHHDLLDQEPLDAVCLFVPPFAHTDAEIIAAERGLAVFVEKPPALSMAKAHEIAAAFRRTGVINAVGFQERHRKTADAARDLLAGQPVVQGLIHRLHGSRALAAWWMIEDQSGGAFVENTIHSVDLLRYLGGDFVSVSARIVDRPDKTADLDIPLSHCATFALASGGVATVTTCTALAHHGHSQFLLVAGDQLCDLGGGALFVDGQEVARDDPGRAAYEQEFATFFEAVASASPERLRSPYDDGIKSLAAVLGAVDSARHGGAPVDLTAPPYV